MKWPRSSRAKCDALGNAVAAGEAEAPMCGAVSDSESEVGARSCFQGTSGQEGRRQRRRRSETSRGCPEDKCEPNGCALHSSKGGCKSIGSLCSSNQRTVRERAPRAAQRQ